MFTPRFNDKVILTHVRNEDMSNDIIYNFYERDPEIAKIRFDMLLDKFDDFVSKQIDAIFTDEIDDRAFKDSLTVLTFWDALLGAKQEFFDITANDLFFALIVNRAAYKQKGVQKIRSYSALYAAKQAADNNRHNLSYKDYINNSEGEKDFMGDYIKAKVKPHGYNVAFNIEIPVKHIGPKKLGLVKLCTDNVPSRLSFEEDKDNNVYTIPAFLWLNMMKKGVSKFNKVRFTNKETSKVSEMVDSDGKYIQDILEANDFETLLSIPKEGSFGVDFDQDTGRLILQQVREVPTLDNNKASDVAGLAWRPLRQREYRLECPNFYLVSSKSDAYNILTPR